MFSRWKNRRITVVVEAIFNNGEVKQTRRSVLYGKPIEQQQRLRLTWVKNIGASVYMSAPLVYQECVFMASVDDNMSGKASVVCIDAQSGTIRWRYSVRGSVRSSIAASEGLVFAQDVYGNLYAIDAENGTLVWGKNLRTGILPPLDDGLAAVGKVLYAGTGKSLYAFHAPTGKQLWKMRPGQEERDAWLHFLLDRMF